LQIPLDTRLKEIKDIPFTISYAIRKNMQVDNLYEVPKDKRPTDRMVWDGDPEELEEWLDNIYDTKKQNVAYFEIDEGDIG
jgi:hypothetical protein